MSMCGAEAVQPRCQEVRADIGVPDRVLPVREGKQTDAPRVHPVDEPSGPPLQLQLDVSRRQPPRPPARFPFRLRQFLQDHKRHPQEPPSQRFFVSNWFFLPFFFSMSVRKFNIEIVCRFRVCRGAVLRGRRDRDTVQAWRIGVLEPEQSRVLRRPPPVGGGQRSDIGQGFRISCEVRGLPLQCSAPRLARLASSVV